MRRVKTHNGILDMAVKILAGAKIGGAAPGQEVRDKERDKSARLDGGGLEASRHADTTQERKPKKRQQVQQQPKAKLQPKLQPQLQSEPKPKSAATPTRRWEAVQSQPRTQKASAGPGPAPMTGSSMATRHLVLRRDESVPLPSKMDKEIVYAYKGTYASVRPHRHMYGNYRNTVVNVEASDSRCISKIIARDRSLVASRLYRMSVTRPRVTCRRYIIPLFRRRPPGSPQPV